ncbi:MAG: MFS transporter [Pseudomonadota bacterium]
MSTCTASAPRALAVTLIVLAAATTVVVASEFIVVGLLPLLARDMDVSIAAAGHLIDAFALSASLLGPPLTRAVAAQPPRRVMIATLLLFAATNLAAGWRALLLAVWGIAHTASVVLCQVRVTLAGRTAPAFAMALNIAAANLGIALGALAGGLIVTRWGIAAIGWGPLGLLLPVFGLVALLASQRAPARP